MNENTGEIRHMTAEEARLLNQMEAGMRLSQGPWHDVSALSENERLKLQGMNRADRRAALRGKKPK